MEISESCVNFLLPFGSFDGDVMVWLYGCLLLSTPFWEFPDSGTNISNVLEDAVKHHLSTPFWEFHKHPFHIHTSEFLVCLSTPFWEFLDFPPLRADTRNVYDFLLPFGSFSNGGGSDDVGKGLAVYLSTPFWEFRR